MGEALDLHRARHLDGAGEARPGEVVPSEVDEHHVLRAVLLRGEQPLGLAGPGVRRARDRAQARPAALARDEALGRRADQCEVVELEQEEVRRRVDAAERAVELEGRRGGRPLGPLARDDLVRVARADVPLAAAHPVLECRAVGDGGARARRGGRTLVLIHHKLSLEPPRDLVRVAGEHLGDAAAVVEADERLDDHEAALREPATVRRDRDAGLEPRRGLVREVPDDGHVERLRLLEADEPRAAADPGVAPEPAALDGLEQEARAPGVAQAQVRPERGQQVGVERGGRCHGVGGGSRAARPQLGGATTVTAKYAPRRSPCLVVTRTRAP